MLQGRRVEDDVGSGALEHPAHGVHVADAGEDDLVTLEQSLTGQAHLGGLQAGLVTVEQIELGRAEAGDLATEL